MIRISAHVSRKLPVSGVDYSSRQASAGMELEVAEGVDPDALKQRFQELYATLNGAVEEQLKEGDDESQSISSQEKSKAEANATQAESNAPSSNSAHGNGANSVAPTRTSATQAQQRAIRAIVRDLGTEVTEVLAPFQALHPGELSIRQASTLIDQLKGQQQARPNRA